MGVILVAFERESEQSSLEQLLTREGHRVVKAANGLTALDLARREPPDLIVSDIVLPRMDGFALCRKWKQDERLQSAPFVFYTRRHEDPKYERFALELGAERFLSRSAAPEALVKAIGELLAAAPPRARPAAPPADDSAAKAFALKRAQEAQQQAQTQAEAAERELHRAQQEQARLRSQLEESQVAQQRLAASEARFRRLFEANPQPMWIVDRATGGFITINETALSLFGYTRAEFLAQSGAALLQAGAETGGPVRMHQRKDGAPLALSIAAQEIEFDGRSAELVSGFDLTQRITAEQELAGQRAAQRQKEFLLELAAQAEDLDEAAVMRRALDQALEATSSALSYWYRVDGQMLALAAWRELGAPEAMMVDAELTTLARASLFTECVRAKHPTSGNDPSVKTLGDGLPDLQRYLAVPLIDEDQTVAVLGVANRSSGYGEEEQRLLLALAGGVQWILRRKRAQARQLAALHRADAALQGMIDSFVRVGERHDPYTAGSARRLAALAVALGREAGLDGERQHALRIAALLHDVGNIAVPAAILAKPAPLTETEVALMRMHVEEGCRLLADIDFGAPIADIVYQSHERYDGSGYPRGLKGEEILLEARVLGLTDTVEAMCSPRPYRAAAGMDAAIEEINRNAGRLYDPLLVAACTRLVRGRGFTLPE